MYVCLGVDDHSASQKTECCSYKATSKECYDLLSQSLFSWFSRDDENEEINDVLKDIVGAVLDQQKDTPNDVREKKNSSTKNLSSFLKNITIIMDVLV